MIHRQPFFTLILVGIAACAAARPATAEYVTYATTTPISALTPWSNTLAFQKFDTSMGTLTEVQLVLNGGLSTAITVKNNLAYSISGDVSTNVYLTVGGDSEPVKEQFTLSSDVFTYNLAANATANSGTLTKLGSAIANYTDSATLSNFSEDGSGDGYITLPASAYAKTVHTDTGGNTTTTQVTTASLGGTITYFYTTIPEPSTLVLLGTLGAGLLAHAWFRRRRR